MNKPRIRKVRPLTSPKKYRDWIRRMEWRIANKKQLVGQL